MSAIKSTISPARNYSPARFARMITLAIAERFECLPIEPCSGGVGTAGSLLVRAYGPHLEARHAVALMFAAHRDAGSIIIDQVEPEQDARPTGRVYLASFECVPDGIPIACLCVHRDEAARVQEARRALGLEEGVEAARVGHDGDG